MTEAEALAKSSGYFNDGHHVGYLPFSAANFLVGTKRWQFFRVDCWGYIIEPAPSGAASRSGDSAA